MEYDAIVNQTIVIYEQTSGPIIRQNKRIKEPKEISQNKRPKRETDFLATKRGFSGNNFTPQENSYKWNINEDVNMSHKQTNCMYYQSMGYKWNSFLCYTKAGWSAN